MQITKELTGGSLLIKMDGRLDTTTAPMLEGELKHAVTDEVTELIFDFEKVAYMSSAGIRVLMEADKVMRRQGTMKLLHVSEEIMDIMDITGLVDLFTFE